MKINCNAIFHKIAVNQICIFLKKKKKRRKKDTKENKIEKKVKIQKKRSINNVFIVHIILSSNRLSRICHSFDG